MVREDRTTWKANYFLKLVELFDEYPKCFLVGVDNVGSKQMQEIRQAMRGHAVILMGKNTMIRKAIRGHLSKNPSLEKLLPFIVQNVGFVFTKEDLGEIRTKLLENRRVRSFLAMIWGIWCVHWDCWPVLCCYKISTGFTLGLVINIVQ
ncbi:ribosomal protein L10 [Ancylostoma duodenale]|uniref:Large ribosomal subunit protein uL10 n=1 Tax=Ancylostoma duodenale TaxID=51022 RepID=A0A0C2CT37_9BILA|nr:ribosomal protein L10 [Ancylostoma duodenale]